MQPFEILSDEEFDELEALLERYGSDNSIASMSMLDGFLTAVVSGPHLIMPSTWLHAIWGGECQSASKNDQGSASKIDQG